MLRARLARPLLAAALGLLVPAGAGALSLSVAGPTSGPVTSGLGIEDPSVGSSLTFTVGLDAPAAIQGYDLILSWDPAELSFVSAADLSGLGFDVTPLGATPAGERAAAIELVAVAAASLFQVTFQVLAVVTDGAVDLRVVANGSGIAPGSLSLANGAAGVVFAVPEPGTVGLLAAALALGAARGRRRGRIPSNRRPR